MKTNKEFFYVIKRKGKPLFLDREGKLDTIQYAHLYDLDVALEEYDLLKIPEKFSVTQVEVCYNNEDDYKQEYDVEKTRRIDTRKTHLGVRKIAR